MIRQLQILFFFLFFPYVLVQAGAGDSLFYKTEEINVTGNLLETDIFSSSSRVTVYSKNYIERTNGSKLSDILRTASGVFIKSYGNSLQTVSLNGLGSEHTLILLNGCRLNSPLNSQYDLSLLQKNFIDKIEIHNSGNSSIYGSDAVGGVINIITKKSNGDNSKNTDLISLGSELNSYGLKKFVFDFSKAFDKFYINASLVNESSTERYKYYFFDGFKNHLMIKNNSDYSVNTFNSYLKYGFNKSAALDLNVNYTSQDRNITGTETGIISNAANQKDNNFNAIISYSNNFIPGYNLKTYISYQNNLINYKNGNFIHSYYKNYEINNLSQIIKEFNDLKLIAGYEISYKKGFSNDYIFAPSRFQPGAFLISELKLFNNLLISPSVRFEHYSDLNKLFVSSKLGLNYKPFKDINLHLKSSAGNNFRAPSFNDLYWKESGNINLNREKSFNSDFGVIYAFKLYTENIIEISYGNIYSVDKIVWIPRDNFYWNPVNIGKSVSNVFNLSINMKKYFKNNLSAEINYTYSRNDSKKLSEDFPGDPSKDKQIFLVPVESAKSNLQLTYKIISANIFYNFIGKRFQDSENKIRLPVIDLFDGNLSFVFRISKISVNTKIEFNNFLNADYQIVPGYPMPLRNYKFILTLNY